MSEAPRWKWRAALLALALAAYANSFTLDLAQDGRALVEQDARIRELSAANLGRIATTNYWWPKGGDGLYRPVTTASLLFNYAVLGNRSSPAGYHAVNFLLHALNVLLVFELALLWLPGLWPAFAAAALWAAHPILTEAVTNVAGRADLLAAACVLGGLLLYLRGRAPAALFAVALVGVFAKENAAVLVGLMLLSDMAGRGCTAGRRWPFYAAAGASLLVLWAVRAAVLGALPPPQPVYVDNIVRASGFLDARLTALKVIGLDLALLVWPVPLAADRSFDEIALSSAADPAAWIAKAVIAAILIAAILRRRRDPLMFLLAGFFGIALLPTSNLLFPIGSIMAERFLYLPSVAFAMAVAAMAFRLRDQRAACIIAAVLVLFYAGRTLARNPAWNGDFALASTDLRTAPRSFRLHDMLAKALFDRRDIDGAVREQEQAWSIVSRLPVERATEFPPAYLGIYYGVKAGTLGSPANAQSRPWYEKSAAVLERAREISQAAERAYNSRQAASGRPARARAGFQQTYFNLANAYLNLGRYPEALDALRYGRGLDPRTPEAYDGMAIAALAMDRPGDAAVALAGKTLVEGFQPRTAAALREIYGRIPGGACQGETCPLMAADLCRASGDVAAAFDEARQPEAARALRDAAARRGCPAAAAR
jgi:tetratricopeptide (TPR) repeat protein